MSTYVFGDVHGRANILRALLEQIDFGPEDKAFFVGDLVNVGPESAEVLRLVKSLADQATTVLGNHDLHLLAVALANQPIGSKDTFTDVLDAPDSDELIAWLLSQKLAVTTDDALIVHAGVAPEWDISTTLKVANEIETALQKDASALFKRMYGNSPKKWRDDYGVYDRMRVGINALTRMRILTHAGAMNFKFKGEYASIPVGFVPWFERTSIKTPIFFGHWSALGLGQFGNVYALDSGCAWERELSCIRLEDKQIFQEKVRP